MDLKANTNAQALMRKDVILVTMKTVRTEKEGKSDTLSRPNLSDKKQRKHELSLHLFHFETTLLGVHFFFNRHET